MELNVDLPQEEEFALSNMFPYSYYNFWFLPQNMLEYCDKYLTMEKATAEEKQLFKTTFLKLIKISLWNTKGEQFLSKNPPHTGHIRQILEMFPMPNSFIWYEIPTQCLNPPEVFLQYHTTSQITTYFR